jgi:CRISPR/Cas system CMR subunit Cmr6 (Cas7 group RAMP superfamily)
MLTGDYTNIAGTGIALIAYEGLGCPYGKSIKGVVKWYKKEYLSMDKKFKIRKLNRKFLKELAKGEIKLHDFGTRGNYGRKEG